MQLEEREQCPVIRPPRVDEAALRAAGLLNNRCDIVKVLGDGEIEKALTLVVGKASASAREKIEKAGGSVQVPA